MQLNNDWRNEQSLLKEMEQYGSGLMYDKALQSGMMVSGIAALGIGAAMFLFGSELTGLSDPNTDSELRFYAVFWGAYGCILIKSARNLVQYSKHVPLLLGLFFLGGVGRLLSAFLVGQPHELFAVFMVAELGLPIIMLWLWFIYNKRMKHAF